MARRLRNGVRVASLLALALGPGACGGGGGDSGGLSGPPGGLLEFDGGRIPGADAAEGAGASGGSAASGGAAGDDGGGAGGSAGTSGAGASGSAGAAGATGTPHCDGVPLPCGALTTTDCPSELGCTIGGDCTGSAYSCFTEFSEYLCISQQGCFWSSYDSSCSGSAKSCDLLGAASCVNQEGCDWINKCAGTATPCSSLLVAQCGDQPGCYVSYL